MGIVTLEFQIEKLIFQNSVCALQVLITVKHFQYLEEISADIYIITKILRQ